jgi:uncharacterized lipoprotein YmbA
MTPLYRLLLATLLLWLTGCASNGGQELQRYTLPADSASAPASGAAGLNQNGSGQRTLAVEGVTLASYLDSQGIVLQSDDIRLREASSHLWAESLKRQLDRGLRQRLARRLPGLRVLGSTTASDALHLRVNVDEFQGRYDGLAVASGRWQLQDDDGDTLALEPFNVTTPLESDGYPALVRALGESWDQVAEDIAQGIRRAL